jgi:hypothetical protein
MNARQADDWYTGGITAGTGDYSVMASYARELPPQADQWWPPAPATTAGRTDAAAERETEAGQ